MKSNMDKPLCLNERMGGLYVDLNWFLPIMTAHYQDALDNANNDPQTVKLLDEIEHHITLIYVSLSESELAPFRESFAAIFQAFYARTPITIHSVLDDIYEELRLRHSTDEGACILI